VEETDNPGRDRILSRIQTALKTPAPRHSEGEGRKPIFAPIPDPLDRFQKECSANITECMITDDWNESASALADILVSVPEGEIFVQDCPILRSLSPLQDHGRSLRWSSEGPPRESSQATITTAHALVAMTGSVLVSAECGGRGASIVAPVHIVLAGINQLAPDLDTAFARVRGIVCQSSSLCLITGSSRTADIEKILVMGAHGPRRLIVVLSRAAR
jgi:L-lactate utilization protein LutC